MSSDQMSVPVPVDPSILDSRARYAALFLRENIGEIQNGIKNLPKADANLIAPIPNSLYDGKDLDPTFHIGIVGAGCAGLFTGMVIDHLNERFKTKITYEILEANKEGRVGGRLFTYEFPRTNNNDDGACNHQYYDVGGMRFPEIEIMKRTFALFDHLEMKKVNPKDPKCLKTATRGQLVPYKLSSDLAPNMYNDIQLVGGTPNAKAFKIDNIPKEYLDAKPDDMVTDKINDFLETYKKNGEANFWQYLMEHGDPFSVRQYLTLFGKYNYNTIEFLEAMNFGSRWYDQAFSEMVIDTLEFDGSAPWWCVMGGAQETCRGMAREVRKRKAKDPIYFGRKVTTIGYAPDSSVEKPKINVQVQGERSVRSYDGVFNSATLGAQQHMKLEGLRLNWGTKQAIRSLGYGASCKVGIQFSSMWWMDKEVGLKINNGGVAHTDRSIRACVYPSYNLQDDTDKLGVLLVSYTWSQEAERIGSLIGEDSPEKEDELLELIFDDLARLHAKTADEADYKRLYDIIKDSYVDHYAYNWYSDPFSVGAFAFFGPGQFGNMYQWITRTDGNYAVIGEASSSHHAWVVGALESAVRAVYQFLFAHSRHSAAINDALQAYAQPITLEDGKKPNPAAVQWPFGPVPQEFDRTSDISYPKDAIGKGASPIAELARQQVLIETVRQEQGGADKIIPKEVTEEQLEAFMSILTR